MSYIVFRFPPGVGMEKCAHCIGLQKCWNQEVANERIKRLAADGRKKIEVIEMTINPEIPFEDYCAIVGGSQLCVSHIIALKEKSPTPISKLALSNDIPFLKKS